MLWNGLARIINFLFNEFYFFNTWSEESWTLGWLKRDWPNADSFVLCSYWYLAVRQWLNLLLAEVCFWALWIGLHRVWAGLPASWADFAIFVDKLEGLQKLGNTSSLKISNKTRKWHTWTRRSVSSTERPTGKSLIVICRRVPRIKIALILHIR